MKKAMLLVEDNPALSDSLHRQLKRYYEVSQAPTLQTAFALCAKKNFQLVLLDRTLPDGDGASLIENLQQQHPETKVCIMSSRCEVSDRIYGLNLGADCYLPKPFHTQEMLALLRSIERRGFLYKDNVLRRLNLELHIGPNLVYRDEKAVHLTRRETQLLELFFQTSSLSLTREQIVNWFWKNDLEATATNVHVVAQRLRKKLFQIRCTIVARYGAGYELKIHE